MKTVLPYDLKAGDVTSNRFYQILEKYCDEIIYKIYPDTYDIINEFQRFIHRNKIEKLRLKEEYLTEYFMIGMLWNRYISTAINSTFMTAQIGVAITNYLENKQVAEANLLKSSLVDKYFLETSYEEPAYSLDSFAQLIDWLTITGHFTEEVKRLANWEKFLSDKSEEEVSGFIASISKYSNWLASINYSFFHEFTVGIFTYLQKNIHDKYGDSDIVLHEKMPEEYHFNIVALQMYNNLWRKDFLATRHKIILLPDCMIPPGEQCEYREKDGFKFCDGCSNCDKCNIGKVKNAIGTVAEVMIVKHENGFEFLQGWKDKENYGFVTVSCVVTLLEGCLQMRRIGLKMQSLFLDNCGCFTHWTNKGEETITGINIKRILKILKQ